jgi:hypothetical protein
VVFFVNGHGKGPHDGACLVIKEVYFAQTTQCSWGKITNVKVVNFLARNYFTILNHYTQVNGNHSFDYFGTSKLLMLTTSTTYACEAIEGTMRIHFACVI